ncbi:hypothetical protein BKA56DRAFT_666307 [Ilyonectria sp. MPI-CAGE-AT-0026]|nr:hypothetical protein BKA56DRAFT_666307 [Ilyonectria sp. MPI-CAGE-AT-0026]
MHSVPEVVKARREMTDLEDDFLQWFQYADYDDFREKIKDSDSRDLLMKEEIEYLFNETVHTNAYQKWCEFSQKWSLDAYSAFPEVEEIIDFILTLRCADPEGLRKAQFTAGMRLMRNIRIGECDFGGTLCGYSIEVGRCDCLDLQESPSQPDIPSLLSNWVMAIDSSEIDLRARSPGQVNRHSGGDSVSRTRTRSTTTDELLLYGPFYFLSIGHVRYCAGESWVKFRDWEASNAANPLAENYVTWKGASYHAVVQLDAGGYAVGGVYMLYTGKLATVLSNLPEDFEGDEGGNSGAYPCMNEIPGPLDMDGKPPFFLAKIADKLEDLKQPGPFKIEPVLKESHNVVRVRVAGTPGKIIPTDLLV